MSMICETGADEREWQDNASRGRYLTVQQVLDTLVMLGSAGSVWRRASRFCSRRGTFAEVFFEEVDRIANDVGEDGR